VVGEHCKVAVDAILDRIDERRLSRSLAADQVCLAVASIELAKEHSTLTESAGRRDRLTLHARGHLEMRQRHLALPAALGVTRKSGRRLATGKLRGGDRLVGDLPLAVRVDRVDRVEVR